MTINTSTAPTSLAPTIDWFEQALTEAAAVRRGQLDGLPSGEDDEVAAGQRASLEQTLDEITAAQGRLAAGTFGTCTRCGSTIPGERLELRPWAATCVGCARR